MKDAKGNKEKGETSKHGEAESTVRNHIIVINNNAAIIIVIILDKILGERRTKRF